MSPPCDHTETIRRLLGLLRSVRNEFMNHAPFPGRRPHLHNCSWCAIIQRIDRELKKEIARKKRAGKQAMKLDPERGSKADPERGSKADSKRG